MAAQQPNGALLQPFPAPPNFYKHFTAENVASLLELQKEQPDAVSNPLTVREADPATDGPPILESKIPSELEYLIPPPPPTEGEYSAFGQTYLVNETPITIGDTGIRQLFPDSALPPPSSDPDSPSDDSQWTVVLAQELMKILRSSLLNFVELVGQMAIAPGTAEEKAADIRDLFNNMHYLINQYRPHQARETLIQKMEQQVLDRKAEIDEVDRLDGKLSELLASLQDRQLQDLHNGDPAEDIVMTNGHGHHSHSKTHNEQVWESVMDAFNR